MRLRMPVLAVGALAVALSAAASTGQPIAQLNAFEVVDSTPQTVTLLADAPPELAGTSATILKGDEPLVGFPVGGVVLMPGPNLIVAPNMGKGWYSAVGMMAPTGSLFEDLPQEE